MLCEPTEKKEIYFCSLLRSINFNEFSKDHPLRTLHVAILFKGRKIIQIAKNDAKKLGTIHAEENLCRNRLSERYEILVIRIMTDGKLSNSRPCKRCIRALQQRGHKHIWYSTEKGFCKERLSDIEKRPSSFDRVFTIPLKKAVYSF